jgi:hypothetical protein
MIGQQLLRRRLAGIDIRALWIACLPAMVGTAAMLAVGWAALAGGAALDVPEGAASVAAAAVGSVAYLGVLAVAFPRALAELHEVRSRLLRRRRGAPLAGQV